jgi:CheY-like chemotaxis protein
LRSGREAAPASGARSSFFFRAGLPGGARLEDRARLDAFLGNVRAICVYYADQVESRRGRMATVLVVEDEPIVRMMAVDCVEEAGFEAIEASDADEALRVMRGRSGIDIVFTDVRMPGTMDGFQLARVIASEWPATQVMVTSGHVAGDEAMGLGARRFFSKPYRADALIAAFREAAGAA